MAPLLGAACAAAVNVVAVWAVLGRPARWGVRGQHHLFDILATLTVAGWLALLPALLVAVRRWNAPRNAGASNPPRWRAVWLGWCAFGLMASAGMHWVLGDHLERQANAIFEGRFATFLFGAMVFGSGFGVLAAQLLGDAARAVSPGAARFVAVHASAALIANHFTLRDDYPSVHAAVTWVAATLLGACFARPVAEWLSVHVRVTATVVFIALVGTVLSPPNEVRLELYRECGAVAPWVLARALWRLPSVPELEHVLVRPSSGVEPRATSGKPLVAAPVVVLITVDALRADVVADPANESRFPNLTRLRNSGLYVPRAVSPGSQTSVSLATMFSGRPFSGQRWALHGEGSARFHYPATDATPRVPTLLSQAGVRTEGFFALRFLAGEFGVTRGFAVEHMLTEGRKHGPASVVMPPLLAAFDKLGANEPTFFFAHLTEPHEPYDRGRVHTGTSFERYLSEIEVVDTWLGRVMQKITQRAKGRGYLIVSADHGEAFGEHHSEFHTKTLYDEVIRVPLIAWGPKLRSVRCEAPASLVDVGPTVLEIFGLPTPASSLGESLIPIAVGARSCDAPRPPLFAQGRLRQVYFTADGLKVIEDHVGKTVEVFDVVRDPGELDNVFGRDVRANRAVEELRAFFRAESLADYEPPYKP